MLTAFRTIKEIKQKSYKDKIGYQYKYAEKVTDYSFENYESIKSIKLYDERTLLSLSDKLKSNQEIEINYNKEKEEYEKAERASSDLKSGINSRIYNIQKERKYLDDLVVKYEGYMNLAEGDEKIAKVFFTKAYNVSEQDLTYIYSKVNKAVKNEEETLELLSN
jgi:hypothetical protein